MSFSNTTGKPRKHRGSVVFDIVENVDQMCAGMGFHFPHYVSFIHSFRRRKNNLGRRARIQKKLCQNRRFYIMEFMARNQNKYGPIELYPPPS